MRFGLVLFSFVVALWLSIYPMPYALLQVRPEWVTLVLIYWVIAAPERIGVMVGWVAGLMLDGFTGAVLGQNAFALAVVAYVSSNLYRRIRMYAVWQQALLVFVLVGIKQLLCHWVDSLTGVAEPNLLFLLPALTSALIWPGVMAVLRRLRRRFGMIRQI